MLSTKIKKPVVKKTRWQITLPKDEGINNRIKHLLTRYEGMTLTEITKLALIELDEKQTNTVYDSLLDNYYSGKIKSESVKNSKELRSLLDKYDK